MHLFAYPHYTSDVTNFLTEMRQKNPDLVKQQQAGRALLWDKQIDRTIKRDVEAGQIAQQPYVYQTKTDL